MCGLGVTARGALSLDGVDSCKIMEHVCLPGTLAFFYDRRRKPVSTLQRIIIVQEYFGKKLQDVDDGVMVMVMMTEMIFIDHLDYFCFLTIMIIMLLRASLHVNLSLHSLLFPLCIYFLSFLEASRLFLCPSYNWNSVIQV